jgi:hypothetical protein
MKRLYPDGCGVVIKKKVETVYKGKRGGIFYKSRSGNKTYIKHEQEPIYTCDCECDDDDKNLANAKHTDRDHDASESSTKRKEPRVSIDDTLVFNMPSIQVLTEESIIIPLFVSCQQICQHIESHILYHVNINRLTIRVLHISDTQRTQLQQAIQLRFRSCFPITVE